MATEAQIAANRANAQSSTGPRTEEGKKKASRNSFKFGLFTSYNCVAPEDREFYDIFCSELWTELAPATAVEEVTAAEFIRSAWRLRRCALTEERLGFRAEVLFTKREGTNPTGWPTGDPASYDETLPMQVAVDRARGQAQNSMRRAKADLDKLQSTSTTKLQNEANLTNAAVEPVAPPTEAELAEQNEANSAPLSRHYPVVLPKRSQFGREFFFNAFYGQSEIPEAPPLEILKAAAA